MLDDVAESFAFDVTRVGLLKIFFILSQSVLYRIADPEKKKADFKKSTHCFHFWHSTKFLTPDDQHVHGFLAPSALYDLVR
jgi:hypothetical protein